MNKESELVANNCKGALIEWLSKNRTGPICFSFDKKGPMHNPLHRATYCSPEGKIYESDWFTVKKLAEHDVSRLVLMDLASQTIKDRVEVLYPIVNDFEDFTNYRGMVQEVCQKTRIDFPVITYEQKGFHHCPLYRAIVTCRGETVDTVKWFTHKKKAAMYVCYLFLKKISEEQATPSYDTGLCDDVVVVKRPVSWTTDEDVEEMRNQEPVVKSVTRTGAVFSKNGIDTEVMYGPKYQEQFQKVISGKYASDERYVNVMSTERKNEKKKSFKQVSPQIPLAKKSNYHVSREVDSARVELNLGLAAVNMSNLRQRHNEQLLKNALNNEPVMSLMTPRLDSMIDVKVQPASVFAVTTFDVKGDYCNQILVYCNWYGKGLPQYTIRENVLGGRHFYYASIKIGNVMISSDFPADTREVAHCHAAWRFLQQIDIVDLNRDMVRAESVDDNVFAIYPVMKNNQQIPVRTWLKILSYLSYEQVATGLLLVCKAFFKYTTHDVYWLSVAHERVVQMYKRWVSHIARAPSFAFGTVFSLREVMNRKRIAAHFQEKILYLGDTIRPKCELTISCVQRFRETTLEKAHYLGIERVDGFSCDVIYHGDSEMIRFDADKTNTQRTERYVVTRDLIPGTFESILYEFPCKREFMNMFTPWISSMGGGYECQFLVDPYKRDYMSLLIIYLPQQELLVEFGCVSS